jgi:hypothetical protein
VTRPRPITFLAFLLLPLAASAADDGRVSFLEQEVRNLQRQVLALSRQMDEIRLRPDRPEGRAATLPRSDETDGLPLWVDAAKWKKVRPGMSELEVIATLGPPSSMREEGGTRVLLYAMELGASGFLGGSVTLRERSVAEVMQPTLR